MFSNNIHVFVVFVHLYGEKESSLFVLIRLLQTNPSNQRMPVVALRIGYLNQSFWLKGGGGSFVYPWSLEWICSIQTVWLLSIDALYVEKATTISSPGRKLPDQK